MCELIWQSSSPGIGLRTQSQIRSVTLQRNNGNNKLFNVTDYWDLLIIYWFMIVFLLAALFFSAWYVFLQVSPQIFSALETGEKIAACISSTVMSRN